MVSFHSNEISLWRAALRRGGVLDAAEERLTDTHLDDKLFAVVKQFRAGVMLMKLHLMKGVPNHRVVAIDQPQSGNVDEVMAEIFQLQSLEVLRQTTVSSALKVRLKTSIFRTHVPSLKTVGARVTLRPWLHVK